MAAAMNMIAINQAHWVQFGRSRRPGNNNPEGNPARLAEAAARLQEVQARLAEEVVVVDDDEYPAADPGASGSGSAAAGPAAPPPPCSGWPCPRVGRPRGERAGFRGPRRPSSLARPRPLAGEEARPNARSAAAPAARPL